MEEYVKDKVGSFPEIRDLLNQLTFRVLSSVRVWASGYQEHWPHNIS